MNLLQALQYEDGYDVLLARSPFSGMKVLFAWHGHNLKVEGGEGVMWDADRNMRTPLRVKATFGNSALGWLEAWVYEKQIE